MNIFPNYSYIYYFDILTRIVRYRKKINYYCFYNYFIIIKYFIILFIYKKAYYLSIISFC